MRNGGPERKRHCKRMRRYFGTETVQGRYDGSSYRTERNGCGVADKRNCGGSERRTAEADEKRCGKRGGSAETRGGFKERNKKKADDYRLNSSVGTDGSESVIYRSHCT